MRYISPYDSLFLMSKDGVEKYRFSRGELIVGDPALDTAGNVIDAAPKTPDSDTLQRIFSKDLAGGTTNYTELCGMGSLTGKDEAGSGISPVEYGYRGTFFEAPLITVVVGTTDFSVAKRWQVMSGDVTYAGTKYTKGQVFDYDGSTTNATAASTGATVAYFLPYDLLKYCDPQLTEEYKIKYLGDGTEATGYWNWETGFVGRDSNTTTDDEFIGYTKS